MHGDKYLDNLWCFLRFKRCNSISIAGKLCRASRFNAILPADFEQSKRGYKLFSAVRRLCVAVDLGKCRGTAIIPDRQ